MSGTVQPRAIGRLLIANRGEIVRRVARTARAMGIVTVAVFSDPDRDSPHVHACDIAVPIGGARPHESYLAGETILRAARRSDADALHPGYGFLSEDAGFAQAVLDAGIRWVGPPPDAMAAMGRKVEAKARAAALGVPLLPSATIDGEDPARWRDAAERIGYPVLVKASAGGGGRGMRAVRSPRELPGAVEAGRREALASFGDATVFLERLLEHPRHVEVQVAADVHGRVVALADRDCSVQRRHQKVIEEAPAPGLTGDVRRRRAEAATSLAAGIGYRGVGTVEFLVEGDQLAFLEMNTRLQVEHPVTEEVLGLDLVRLQLDVAEGLPLDLPPGVPEPAGHAIEARLYAEDVPAGYTPAPGTVLRWRPPAGPGIRVDDAIEDGTVVSQYYDPMLAKLIAWGRDRPEAVRRLRRAVELTEIAGLTTNRDLLAGVLHAPDFASGHPTTAFLEEHPEVRTHRVGAASRARAATVAAMASAYGQGTASPLPPELRRPWRNVAAGGSPTVLADGTGPVKVGVRLGPPGAGADPPHGVDALVDATVEDAALRGILHSIGAGAGHGEVLIDATLDGLRQRYRTSVAATTPRVITVVTDDGAVVFHEQDRLPEPAGGAPAAGPTAPLPGTVVEIGVRAGAAVQAGQVLLVLEAMKMEHPVKAPAAATVEAVLVEVGESVEAHQLLVRLGPPE